MTLNQTVRGLIDRLPTLTSEERWVVQAVLDIADKRDQRLRGVVLDDDPPEPDQSARLEIGRFAPLTGAPYYVTARELDVLELLLAGLSNKEVAAKLGISFKTVQSHRQRVMDKLGARSPMHLAEIVRQVSVS